MDRDGLHEQKVVPRSCGMDTKLRLVYDRKADIFDISMCAPYPEQQTEELADEVIARISPETTELGGEGFILLDAARE